MTMKTEPIPEDPVDKVNINQILQNSLISLVKSSNRRNGLHSDTSNSLGHEVPLDTEETPILELNSTLASINKLGCYRSNSKTMK